MPGLHAHASAGDFKQAEQNLAETLTERAINQLQGVNGPDDVHLRDILPDEDLEAGDDQVNGWNGTDRVWLQGDMSSAGLMQSYQIDPNAKADGKVMGFYAISAEDADPATTEVEFRDGTGSTFERVAFQEAHQNQKRVRALMRNPIIFNSDHAGEIYQDSDDTSTSQDTSGLPGDFRGDAVIFHGFVAEKAGTTLGTRAHTEAAPMGTARGTYNI